MQWRILSGLIPPPLSATQSNTSDVAIKIYRKIDIFLQAIHNFPTRRKWKFHYQRKYKKGRCDIHTHPKYKIPHGKDLHKTKKKKTLSPKKILFTISFIPLKHSFLCFFSSFFLFSSFLRKNNIFRGLHLYRRQVWKHTATCCLYILCRYEKNNTNLLSFGWEQNLLLLSDDEGSTCRQDRGALKVWHILELWLERNISWESLREMWSTTRINVSLWMYETKEFYYIIISVILQRWTTFS